jgi:hypothetical protein
MKKPKMRAPEANVKPRRDFLKLGAGALTMLGAYAHGGPEKAAASQMQVTAGVKDAQNVVWEMRQSQRPPISVDVHAHWVPPSLDNAQKEVGGGRGARHSLSEQLTGNIRWMDERAVQAVIFTVDGFKPWYWLSPAEAAREAALVNDAGFEANEAYPNRIFLGAEIPALDPEL